MARGATRRSSRSRERPRSWARSSVRPSCDRTSGEDAESERRDRLVPEEEGGPFVPSKATTEFARGPDASNFEGATREPLPKTSKAGSRSFGRCAESAVGGAPGCDGGAHSIAPRMDRHRTVPRSAQGGQKHPYAPRSHMALDVMRDELHRSFESGSRRWPASPPAETLAVCEVASTQAASNTRAALGQRYRGVRPIARTPRLA